MVGAGGGDAGGRLSPRVTDGCRVQDNQTGEVYLLEAIGRETHGVMVCRFRIKVIWNSIQ